MASPLPGLGSTGCLVQSMAKGSREVAPCVGTVFGSQVKGVVSWRSLSWASNRFPFSRMG
jgi:hypothetical protein